MLGSGKGLCIKYFIQRITLIKLVLLSGSLQILPVVIVSEAALYFTHSIDTTESGGISRETEGAKKTDSTGYETVEPIWSISRTPVTLG